MTCVKPRTDVIRSGIMCYGANLKDILKICLYKVHVPKTSIQEEKSWILLQIQGFPSQHKEFYTSHSYMNHWSKNVQYKIKFIIVQYEQFNMDKIYSKLYLITLNNDFMWIKIKAIVI